MKTLLPLRPLLVIIIVFAVNVNSIGQVASNISVNNKNYSKVLSQENKRFIIKDNINLRGKIITIGANSILDFQGGSISNGVILGNKTLVLGAPYCIFEKVVLKGTFKGDSYPEWFNGDIQKCVDHFKSIVFIEEEYVLSKPLNLLFGCKLQGSSFNVLRFNLPIEYYGKGCINVAAYCEISNFIIYVESDNPAIEIKSCYTSSSLSHSDYIQRIAPETTSPGGGTSAAIHIHDLILRTALGENKRPLKSTVQSTSPAIWLAGGGGFAAYDKDAQMYKITKSPGMWGIRFSNIDICGRWLIGIKCEQINESISDKEINELEIITNNNEISYKYWEPHNKEILSTLRVNHKWGYGWITGCVFDNIKIHTAIGGIWLGREHENNGRVLCRGASIQHFVFSNIQMQYWNRTNSDKSINIGSEYFVKLNNCNGITFTNCEPWDWPMTTDGVEKPFQIDDSYNVWNIAFQGYSQWESTTTNFIQYENGAEAPLCGEHRAILSMPEASFGMGNIAILDDYLTYTNYDINSPESMKCNKQLRLLPPGTYSLPNINNKILNEFFKIEINNVVSDAWLEIRLVADVKQTTGTLFRRMVTFHVYSEGKSHQMTMRKDEAIDRELTSFDWYEEL